MGGVVCYVRLEPTIAKQIKAAARRDRRSLSQMISMLVEAGLKAAA